MGKLTDLNPDTRYLLNQPIPLALIEDALFESFRSGFFVESHYLSTMGSGNFLGSSSNGAYAYIKGEAGHPGIMGLSTGGASNGAIASSTGMGNNSSGILLADGITKYLAIIKIPVLRDVSNDFVIEIGFQSAGSSIGLDACCFVYDSASPNWQYHTRNNLDLAIAITNTVVVANKWYEMSIAVSNGIATFEINEDPPSVTSSKLPLSSRMVGASVDIRKVSGTTGRDILIDYQCLRQKIG